MITSSMPPSAEAQHTVADLFAAYARDVLPDLAPKSQYYYRWFLKRFGQDFGALPLAMLTPAVLKAWQQELRQRLSASTVRTYAVLGAILETAVRDYEWLAANPLRTVRKPREPRGRVRFLSEDERAWLLEACQRSQNPALYLLVVLAISTGGRKDELRFLRWQDVDLERGYLRLGITKNREGRAVPVTGLALDLLTRWATTHPPESDLVFPGRRGDRPVLIEKGWRSARKRAGLLDFKYHDLRHCCASYLAMAGASLLDIATILGHKKIASTMRYTHLTSAHTHHIASTMTAHIFGTLGQDPATPTPEETMP
jgi:integrase